MDAIAGEDLEDSFDGFPWDVIAEVDRKKLHASLDPASREEATLVGIVAIESGNATHQTVSTVLTLIFPLRPPRPRSKGRQRVTGLNRSRGRSLRRR
jgi:hypothetical protein